MFSLFSSTLVEGAPKLNPPVLAVDVTAPKLKAEEDACFSTGFDPGFGASHARQAVLSVGLDTIQVSQAQPAGLNIDIRSDFGASTDCV